MTMQLRFAQVFAAPGGGDLTAVLCRIGTARALLMARRLGFSEAEIESFGAQLLSRGASAYSPELGITSSLMKNGEMDLAKAQLAVYLVGNGCTVDCEFAIKTPTYIYSCGNYFETQGALRPMHAVKQWNNPSGSATAVSRARSKREELGALWHTYSPVDGLDFGLSETGLKVDIGQFPSAQCTGASPRSIDEPGMQADVQHFQKACLELQLTCPDHAAWVNTLVRQVYLASLSTSNVDTSGSSGGFPGCIYLNPHPTPLLTAEALIHEACHMALNAASDLHPLICPDSSEAFYSPIKGTERPLEMVFYAAHATVSTAIFLSIASRRRELIEVEQKQLTLWRNFFETYSTAMEDAKSLTAFGRAIWDAASSRYEEHFSTRERAA